MNYLAPQPGYMPQPGLMPQPFPGPPSRTPSPGGPPPHVVQHRRYPSHPSRTPSPGPPPVPPMKFQKTEISHSMTNQPIFTIATERSSLSGSKNRFFLNRHWTGQPMGSFKLSSMETSKIEFDVNGAANRLQDVSMISGSKWSFQPMSFPAKQWQWERKSEKFTLTDEGGMQIATVVDGNLVVEPLGFGEMAVDEIVLTGWAMWQKRKKDKGDKEAAEAGGEIISAIVGGG